MKRFIFRAFIFVSIFFTVSYGDTLTFSNHKFTYGLSKVWEIAQQSEEEGYYTIILKRAPVVDKKGIEVIPNILIKLIKIAGDSTGSDDIEIFTRTCLLYNAPPEVQKDFSASKKTKLKYRLPIANSYAFNSPYKDNFNSNHICLYLTALDLKKLGIFICIDSTDEVFKKIESEIIEFLKSISMT
jgi:hypothetical protein